MEQNTKLRARCTLTLTQSHWRAALLLVTSFLGCSGLVGPPQPLPSIIVTVAPASTSVLLGERQTFAATVENTLNTGVSWSVNGIPGGNAAVGTIDADGVYTAPVNLPAPNPVAVRATSTGDTSKSSESLVTIASDISVSVSPGKMQVELGASHLFTATASSAGNPNRSVAWTLFGSGCSGVACGTVDASGNYTAPQILPAPPAVSLTATSAADSSKSATATITVTSSFSLALAGPNFLNAGSTVMYAATLTPAANSNPSLLISWSVAGTGCTTAACGTITPSGTYTAPSTPPPSGTVQIVATPQADPSKAASLSVSIRPVITVSVSPSAATVALGATQAFQATVTGAQDATVTWFVNGVVGGNSTIGLLPNSQTDPDSTIYTAPQSMPAGGAVTVLAQSNANPSVSARVMVTLTATINVNVSPASAMAAVSETQTFAAHVNNTPDQNVSWLVNGIAGGNPAIGQICAHGSDPCKPVLAGSGGSVYYLAPDGVPSPNPVTVTATSQADPAQSASASVTILPHLLVDVQPASASMANAAQLRFTATVTGSEHQQVIWTVAGTGCANPGDCGSIDSAGLYTAPPAAPSPDLIDIVATSLEDEFQSGTATVTIKGGPAIFSLSPTSAYAATAGGFTLLVSGSNFSASNPGPGSTLLVAGTPRVTSCESAMQCITSLSAGDLASPGNLSVQVQNPDGSLSNVETFVVLAQGFGPNTIALTPSAPESDGNDIVVVELSTNGGSGAPSNVSLNIAAIGAYALATSSCALGGNPVIVRRPANGIATADLCVFSVSALDPLFHYYVSGPPAPDIAISNREPLGLGLLHLTLQIPATAAPGPRTLFVENPKGDRAAGTGAIEVQ